MNKAFEKIIKRLEELKKHYHKCCLVDYNEGAEVALGEAMSIVQKESEEYNNGWIPCSEKLPEEEKDVLISDIFGNITVERLEESEIFDDTVIAWQPLPEPYTEK